MVQSGRLPINDLKITINKMTVEPSELNKKTHAAITGKGSALSRYLDVVVGQRSILKLVYFEFCTFLSLIPGAGGIFLRKIFWPYLFKQCSKNVVFGRGIRFMHPNKISILKGTVISDYCVLDGRSPDANSAIQLGEDTMLSHGVILSCKGGDISLGNNVGIGVYSVIQSTRDNPIEIGSNVIIGPRSYISGGGNYNTERVDIPICKQGMKIMGGTIIEDGVWLGANVTVLGGTNIGADSIVGAGAVVTKSLPVLSISVGTPARVIAMRT